MLLIGTMDWASTRERGTFRCPVCELEARYRLRASRPFLTLYFIPVVPIGSLQEYVQCQECRQSFEPSVVAAVRLGQAATTVDEKSSDGTVVEYRDDLLRVLALIMVEDGHVTENEIRIARRLFENICEENLSREELGQACSDVRRMSVISFLSTVKARRSYEERLMLVQAMFGVAGADGEITAGRMRSLLQSKDVLELDEVDFQEAIATTTGWLR